MTLWCYSSAEVRGMCESAGVAFGNWYRVGRRLVLYWQGPNGTRQTSNLGCVISAQAPGHRSARCAPAAACICHIALCLTPFSRRVRAPLPYLLYRPTCSRSCS